MHILILCDVYMIHECDNMLLWDYNIVIEIECM